MAVDHFIKKKKKIISVDTRPQKSSCNILLRKRERETRERLKKLERKGDGKLKLNVRWKRKLFPGFGTYNPLP